ncbi:DsbA family protein [Leptospira interrogans]
MSSKNDTKLLAPIELGRGDLEMEVFLEPTCPFSKRAFEKLPSLVSAVGEDKLTVKVRFVSQPWHLFSGIVTRSILAASATDGGTAAALKAIAAIYQNRDDFEFENHCSGPNMNRTPAEIVDDISKLTGIDLSEAFKLKSVDHALRWHTKYSRQNGIHVSPTFAINGLVEPAMSSGQTIEEWSELLAPYLST